MVLKTCKLCGKSFETNYASKQICNDVHYKTCEVCGKQFPVNSSNYTKKTCSKTCMKVTMSKSLKSEEVRNKTIQTNLERYGAISPSANSEIQERVKATNRAKYGSDYAIQSEDIKKRRNRSNILKYGVDNPAKLSSVKQKQKDTMQERYGVSSPLQHDKFREKSKTTCRNHYGVDNPMQSEKIRAKAEETCRERYGASHYSQTQRYAEDIHDTSIKRYGVEHHLKSPEVKQKIAQTNIERYGTEHPMQNEEIKLRQKDSLESKYGGYTLQNDVLTKKMRATCLERYGTEFPSQSDIVKSKVIETNMQRYGVPYTSQLASTHSKAAETRASVRAVDGSCVDSIYEKYVYDFLITNDVEFSYQTEVIDYEYKGETHRTMIDFKVGDLLFEVKGGHLMQGCFDYQGVPIDVKLDVYKKHHVIVITDELGREKFGKSNSSVSNGLRYLNKCPEPLIGVDISLFTYSPEFPYRDDRPHCFYDVKVNGQKSAHEAFYDPEIRWKMILNRIQYSGGFIDSKQILTALNVTRTCKQPSWFSKQLAKNIIQKYCTSTTILDTMAGWGARADAANELHRSYVGVDFNKELVDWHHSKGRTNIVYGDAREFKYDKPCSIFICPPYSDPETGRCFEDYNFDGFETGAKSLSQCDWLKIVLKNVPNAHEAVMVCKIVDKGWEKYVVDTLTNESHFGTNHEYIIVINNEEFQDVLKEKDV